MEWFVVNTYGWVIAKGEVVYVKYHWKPKAGVETIDRRGAVRLHFDTDDFRHYGGSCGSIRGHVQRKPVRHTCGGT